MLSLRWPEREIALALPGIAVLRSKCRLPLLPPLCVFNLKDTMNNLAGQLQSFEPDCGRS